MRNQQLSLEFICESKAQTSPTQPPHPPLAACSGSRAQNQGCCSEARLLCPLPDARGAEVTDHSSAPTQTSGSQVGTELS